MIASRVLLLVCLAVMSHTVYANPTRAWVVYPTGSYNIHPEHLTWGEAWEACVLDEGHLIVIDTAEEMAAFVNLIAPLPPQIGKSTTYHVGIHDHFLKSRYVTIHGQPLSTTILRWEVGQPDDIDGSQRCCVVTKQSMLNDEDCDITHPFVCEKGLI